jgi:transglutaminase-like putative cysteine protease
VRSMFLAPHLSAAGCLVHIPGGTAGIKATIRRMRALVNEWRTNPALVSAARSLVFHTIEKDDYAEVDALYRFVRDVIRYVRDVNGVETLSTPYYTLMSKSGDCDDQTSLLATLLEAVGYPTKFVVGAFQSDEQYDHVYFLVLVNDEWIGCDPTEREYLGWEPPLPFALFVEGE